MDRLGGYSGNGYTERQTMLNRNLNNRFDYAKKQNNLKKQENNQGNFQNNTYMADKAKVDTLARFKAQNNWNSTHNLFSNNPPK